MISPGVSRSRLARHRRRAGQAMVASAVVGVIVAIVGTVIGWQVVGQIDATSSDTVAVSLESLDSLEDTIALADRLLTSTEESLTAVEDTLATVSSSFATADSVVRDVSELAATAGPGLANTSDTLDQLAEVGTTIDGVLGALSDVPFGPSYDPAAGLGETLGTLARDVEPIAEALQDVSVSLNESSASLEALDADLTDLAGNVASITADLDDTQALLDSYRANVTSARRLAEDADSGLASDLFWTRLLIVFGGLNFAVGQIVPFWFGREQLRAASAESDIAEQAV